MGALPQPKPEPESLRKPASSGSAASRLNRYGRDPSSPLEQLRGQSDYERDTGYAPFYHALMADLPRIAGQSSVIYAFVLTVLRLSLGTPNGKGRRERTGPVSAAELAEYCRCSVRDIERQFVELAQRGVIATEPAGRGKRLLSLLYRSWETVEDYAVWKRKQAVAIDEPADDADDADEEMLPVSKDAVTLTRAPQVVRPGRACRAVKVKVGVRELAFHNQSQGLDVTFQAVVDSGRLVVSATSQEREGEAKGEDKANAQRHSGRFRDQSTNGKPKQIPANAGSHPRESEIVNLFDPLLQKSGARLLVIDRVARLKAASELGEMPTDFLLHFLHAGKGARAARPISSPAAVASIVREARQHWEKQNADIGAIPPKPQWVVEAELRSRAESIEAWRKILADPESWSAEDVDFAREQLAAFDASE